MAEERTSAWARWVARVVMRRPLAIIATALIIGAIAFTFVQKLRIDQELRALLPDDFPSVVHLEQLEERIVNPTNLYLTLRSPSREANIAYGAQLAERLGERSDIRYVIFRQDPAYFRDHLLLYASLEDLLDLRKRVIDGIQEQVRRETSMFGSDGDEGPATALDELSEDSLRERYKLDTKTSEYYETDEGRLMVIRARPTRPHIDFAFTTKLVGEVETMITELDPKSFHPELEVRVAGSYVDHAHSIQNGVVGGTAISIGLLILTLALYFRGARAIPMVLVPLVLAALVALAIAQQAYGELNLVSAFMFAVLLGLGIDFMVHILARYRDERVGHGLEQQAALERALTTTGMSTLTGALSTALAFAVLSVVDFRGISQFGVIASIGVLLTYVGAIFVMPAMAVLIEKVRPWKPRAGATIATAEPEPAPQQPGKRTGFRPWVTGVGLIMVVIATGLGGYYGQHVEFEFDLNEIDAQPDPLTAEEMARKEEYRKAVGSASTTAPAVALTNNLDQSREAYRQLRALLDMSPKAFTAFTGLPSKRPTHAPSEDDPFLAHAGGLGSANLGLDEDEPPPAPTPKVADEDEDEEFDEDEDDDDSMFEEDPRFVELAKKAQELNKLDPEVAKQLEAYGPERLQMMHDRIIEVASIHAFVPEHQQLKLEVIRDIRKWIDRKRGAFKGEAAKKLEEWEPYLKVENPVTIANLPEWVRVQFEDAQGELGKFVVIWTRGTKADYRESQYIYRGFISLETSTGEVPVAADYFVVTEVFDTLKADGPVVVGLALIALVVSVTVLFRSFTAPIIVLLTVVCALIWLAGIMAVQGWKFHFLNIIALPLLIGMGQDDAIHLLHRNMELKSIKGALRKTGGVLLFTTVTTQIGFGGMLVVNHPGLSSLGWVAVVGMMLCLIASVTVVPLLLSLGKPKA